jgi:hypothetical protein
VIVAAISLSAGSRSTTSRGAAAPKNGSQIVRVNHVHVSEGAQAVFANRSNSIFVTTVTAKSLLRGEDGGTRDQRRYGDHHGLRNPYRQRCCSGDGCIARTCHPRATVRSDLAPISQIIGPSSQAIVVLGDLAGVRAFATARVPMVAPPPARLSITTLCLNARTSRCPLTMALSVRNICQGTA